jgi:methylthioribose-1-phosphate isomerase
MKVGAEDRRTLQPIPGEDGVDIIDQRQLPHALVLARLRTLEEVAVAIREMWLRGAPLIGVAAAYGLCFALRKDPSDASMDSAIAVLRATRPTAINLAWALAQVDSVVRPLAPAQRCDAAFAKAKALADADAEQCHAIGEHGFTLLRQLCDWKQGKPLQILTHCNAGWLATIDWGTALAPVYLAHRAGYPVHVWVDETRPRNQGASLTAWELGQEGVPHTLIADNAGGLLMQRGQVDACIVGTDRTTREGDVCNKVGTYLKALAAHEHGVPFLVAAPSSSIDWTLRSGVDIPIEERDPGELLSTTGRTANGRMETVLTAPAGTRAANPAFDVTPAKFVTRLVTERGVCEAKEKGLLSLFPERAP